MGKRRKDTERTWSPPKVWLMGIASALLIALASTIGSILYNKWQGSPLSDRERTAVYALIDDMRRHPFFIYGVYQGSHDFITSRWRKCDETDSFYESAETPVTVFGLGYAMGRYGDGLRLFDEKCGVKSGAIKGLDTFKEAADGTVARGYIESKPEQRPATIELDAQNLTVYTLQPNAFPVAVVAHASALDVPSSIRERLAAMQTFGSPMSLKTALYTSADFVLSSDESMVARDIDLNKPVYFHGSRFSLFEYASLCLRLARSVQEWADRHSIDLGNDDFRVYERIYDARQR